MGAPGLSIPIGLADNGMPVGFQLQSRPGKPQLGILYELATPTQTGPEKSMLVQLHKGCLPNLQRHDLIHKSSGGCC